MDVRFLSFNMIDWAAYIEFSQEILGISPTRCLDSNRISIDSPQAFIVSLHNLLEGSPTITNYNILKTVQASFMIHADCDTWLAAQQMSNITFLSRTTIDGCFGIASGTLFEWRTAILDCCKPHIRGDVRLLFNKCFVILNAAGVKIWLGTTKTKHKDGTIIIKAK